MNTIIGLYDDLSTAQQVVRDLRNNGIAAHDIHLATYDSRAQRKEPGGFFESLSNLFGERPKDVGTEPENLAQKFVQWGVPEPDAQRYAEAVRRGTTLLLVDAPEKQSTRVRETMDAFGPADIDQRAGLWQQEGWKGYDAHARPYNEQEIQRERQRYATDIGRKGETTVPVIHEELEVGKRQVQRGGARLYTRVTEHPVEETVRLRDETVHVERRPVDRPANPQDLEAFQEGTFEVTETDEEAVVGKRARVVEEVSVRKDVQEQEKTIRDTVRRTEVGTENLAGQERYGTFESYEPRFRQHFESNFSNRNYDYSHFQPAYRYGYELAGNERYSGRSWNEIEPQVRRDWEQQHPRSKWDQFRDAVHQGWETVTGQR